MEGKTEQNEQFSDFHGTALVAHTGHAAAEFNRARRTPSRFT